MKKSTSSIMTGLSPITLEDLNKKTIFMERDSINPEIRDVFKELGIIENHGIGFRL